jgi:hypothetical protein
MAETGRSPHLLGLCRLFSFRFLSKAKHCFRPCRLCPQPVTSGEGLEAHAVFGTLWYFRTDRLCFLLYTFTPFEQLEFHHPVFCPVINQVSSLAHKSASDGMDLFTGHKEGLVVTGKQPRGTAPGSGNASPQIARGAQSKAHCGGNRGHRNRRLS